MGAVADQGKMRSRRRASPRIRTAGALGVLILVALVWVDARVITGEPNTRDSAQYENLAVSLARSGRFESGGVLTREVEPFHVGVLALQIRLDPRLAEVRASGRVAEGGQSRAVKQQNLLWSGLLLAGAAVQVLLLRRERGRVLVAGLAVVAVTLLLLDGPDLVDASLAELPAAALVVWAGVCATLMVKDPSWRRAWVLGAVIGALALTRAVFMYAAVPYVLLLAGMLWSGHRSSLGPVMAARRVVVWVLVGLVGFGVVVGPWAARNVLEFGDPGISERGGEVLYIRAMKNTMDGYQHRGAWVYWAPLPMQSSLASLLQVDLDDFQRGRPLSVLARYDESAKDESFQRIASRDIQERADELMSAGLERREARQVAEGEFGALALSGLWADPGAFLRTTPVFMWRFSWPMKFSSVVPKALLGAVNMVGMALLLSAAALAVLRRRAVMFAVVGLPAGAAMFYALVTHALARYAQPLAPTMILLIVMAVASILDRRTSSLRLDRRTE